MTASLTPLSDPPQRSLLAKLAAAVRPEFQGAMIPIDVDNPVFAPGRCQVAACVRGTQARGLCAAHYIRWRHAGKPDLAGFCATTGAIAERAGSERARVFDLGALRPQARLEMAYSIQCRSDDRTVRLLAETVRQTVRLLADADTESLLDRPLDEWLQDAVTWGLVGPSSRTLVQLRYAYQRLTDLAERDDADSEFARDTWRAQALGIAVTRPPHRITFGAINQPWLRAAAKRYARFRLGAGKAFGTVDIDVRAARWLSTFLAGYHPDSCDESALTREVVEAYIPWLQTQPLSNTPINTYLVALRGFLETCRRHRWLPRVPADAAVYLDELPPRPRPLPRFIPEFVMGQLEDPDNLARLPDEITRHLVVVIIETGLRASDACALPFNPIIDDSVGWPCLQFYNHKMRAEQLVPLSQTAAEAIRSQQHHLRQQWSPPPAYLFPSTRSKPGRAHAFHYATLRSRFARWQHDIGLHDEAGQPVQVTPHQFRHTLGTRMINQGVPQHVVQKLLGHASPQMTARYATIHDSTVRANFDDYQRRRVDVHGDRLPFDTQASTADAEWVKHNLARVQATLPNGYCGRPPQQDCPHPNACLTCPDFQTTPKFLPMHRRQHDDTLELLAAAEQAGNTRLIDTHRQVATNLGNIITALETVDGEEPIDAD